MSWFLCVVGVEVQFYFYFSECGYSVFPEPFIEETILPHFTFLVQKNKHFMMAVYIMSMNDRGIKMTIVSAMTL